MESTTVLHIVTHWQLTFWVIFLYYLFQYSCINTLNLIIHDYRTRTKEMGHTPFFAPFKSKTIPLQFQI